MTISKIAIVGSCPPPYGGVSVHIQRFIERLSNDSINFVFYDALKDNWFLKSVLNRKIKVIHLHTSGFNTVILIKMFLLSLLNKKTIITYHSLRTDRKPRSRYAFFLKNVSQIIAVSGATKDKLITIGAKDDKIMTISAFLLPIVKQDEIIKIPKEIWDFIENHNPIISANAWKISFYNNQDLYGIDMCIELCKNLKDKYPDLGFVFCVPMVSDLEYFEKMQQRIASNGTEENFLFVTQQYPFYPVLMKSHVFVRPTNTDSYAISVAEAIHFRIPAVASDVCPRPEGTILFRSRDINDLTLKVENVLRHYQLHKNRLDTAKIEDNFEKITRIYRALF